MSNRPEKDETPLSDRAARVLEWERVLAMVAGHARSALGAELCRTLPLERDLGAARARLQETAEMAACGDADEAFPSLSFPDIREVLQRAGKGAALETPELRDIALVITLAQEAQRYLNRRGEIIPALRAAGAVLDGIQEVRSLKDAIDRCVDPEGNIRESATPDLKRLTRHAQDLKQGMRRRLDVILASSRYAEVLQERYFAQRQGRYVVPVKAEMQSRIPGIVHDVSSSGATVFLEPRELVDVNNAIKVADLEVEREVRRILVELSAQTARHGPMMERALEALARLDAIAAKAAFSRRINGQPVSLNDAGRIVLKQARHPLLLLSRGHDQVVPNDLVLDETVRVLVISGPNTGGKTVTLKILGLFALMVRAGLPPSCAADSDMALFPNVYADIGDAQDLAKDLSSFSAHIVQMIGLLEEVKARADTAANESEREGAPGTPLPHPPVLVLLDEPATSTDPAEGAALAQALLTRLAQMGMKVVATTHYQSLKALAQSTPGFLNASVGFDVATLSPTYRLMVGMPGGSSAIEIAGRLGMDETILDHALDLLNRDDRTRQAHHVERMLADVQDKQRRLDEDLARAAELKAETERAARAAAEVAERLQASERDERKGAKRKLTEELLRARAEIQGILDALKREQTVARARDAKERLAEVEAAARTQLTRRHDTVPLQSLRAGDRVEIVSFGTIGTLSEAPEDKKRVRVRVGDAEMSVATSLLVGIGQADGDNVPSRPAMRASGSTGDYEAPTVVDVRGKTADEALDETVAALDRACMAGHPSLRIIHGHGTGRLKACLRDYLKSSPYVATFRAGAPAEGGDGVTMVQLK